MLALLFRDREVTGIYCGGIATPYCMIMQQPPMSTCW
jgi:hypothetical protein